VTQSIYSQKIFGEFDSTNAQKALLFKQIDRWQFFKPDFEPFRKFFLLAKVGA
jgi:hypothetical protein